MINKSLQHPTFLYDTFDSYIFELNGHWYIQEDWSWPIYDEEGDCIDESYGSILFDLENKRKLSLGCYYVTDDEEWLDFMNKPNYEWEDMDEEFNDKMYQEDIEYYLNEIEKLKNNESRIKTNH